MILGDLDTASKNGLCLESGGNLPKGKDLELENKTLNHIKKKKSRKDVEKNIPPYFKTVVLYYALVCRICHVFGERKPFNSLFFILCKYMIGEWGKKSISDCC